jgi:hypothetical protein
MSALPYVVPRGLGGALEGLNNNIRDNSWDISYQSSLVQLQNHRELSFFQGLRVD